MERTMSNTAQAAFEVWAKQQDPTYDLHVRPVAQQRGWMSIYSNQRTQHAFEGFTGACNAHEQLVALTRRAQEILAAYLPPDGSSDQETITALLELFDGPESRAALAAAGAQP
jgi:hypothetical protein